MFLIHRLPKLNAQRVRHGSVEDSLHFLQLPAGRLLYLHEKHKPTAFQTMSVVTMEYRPICIHIHIQHYESDGLD